MSAKENLANTFGTVLTVVIAIIFCAFIPLKIINAESHTVIAEIRNFRFFGLAFIFFGIIGYLACCWNFIVDAKGIPAMEGMQKHLIVQGPYKYVRNPIYVSFGLIIFGEAVYFQSLDLLLYLLGWMVVFQIRVVFFEEPYLSVAFGKSYEAYRKSTPRWIPHLKAYNIVTN